MPVTTDAYAQTTRLAEAAQAGDRWAREALAIAFRPLVCRLAARFPPKDQEDVIQDLWIAFYTALPRYDPARYPSFAAFIKGYLAMTVRQMQDGRHRQYTGVSVTSARSLDAPVDDGSLLLGEMIGKAPDNPGMAYDALVQAIRTLPAGKRRALAAYLVEGGDMARAAARLGIKEGSLRGCLSRTRKRLAKGISEKN